MTGLPCNVHVMHRPNQGYDFGAWGHALEAHEIPRRYSVVAFINSSVLGPLLRAGPDCGDWTRPFTNMLSASADTMLVGTSINMHEIGPHVQSMMFVVRQPALLFLVDKGVFRVRDGCNLYNVALNHEIRMSQLVLQWGWNINCMLHMYQGHDYRLLSMATHTTRALTLGPP